MGRWWKWKKRLMCGRVLRCRLEDYYKGTLPAEKKRGALQGEHYLLQGKQEQYGQSSELGEKEKTTRNGAESVVKIKKHYER